MRATAKAFTMQALIKYHGLRDWDLRIPYHDSISVNTDCLYTVTTVEFGDYEDDVVLVNGEAATGRGLERVVRVLDRVRGMAGISQRARVESWNSLTYEAGKGVGFSSAAGAALAAAAYEAAGLRKTLGWDLRLVSRVARLLAGSACRSVVGGYAIWHAGESDEDSYAERIASREDFEIAFLIIPLPLDISTEAAHREAEASSFFWARVASAQRRCGELIQAIRDRDFERFGELVELDSLELHAVTMTGPGRHILMTPESLRIIEKVRAMRREGIPVYFSMQTGPSVFVNTLPEWIDYVESILRDSGLTCIRSGVGGGVELISH